VATEPLNPRVPSYTGRFAENTSGIITAIVACIQAAGGAVESYPSNTAGIIQALIDLQVAIQGGGTGTQSVAVLAPGISGEALAKGDAVYVSKSDGKLYKASNVLTREKATVLGLVKAGVASAGLGVTVVARGPIEGLTGLLTGFEYYLDSSGVITATAPVGGSIYSTRLGQAIDTDKLDVQPESPIFLV
tara:strand:- start:1040 stop:1609 length:570 start_codon:yes stop_codon:yes gene_type:complete